MDVTGVLAEHVASALRRDLPASAAAATKLHILDTIAAAVAGSRLPGGVAGRAYARSRAEDGRSVLIGDRRGAPIEHAVLANAMAAHADESDDSHELSKSHPGCSIVPTALATAEEIGHGGLALIRAVAVGYDVGPRVNMALWPSFADVRSERRATPGISGTFGSASAAAALRGFGPERVRILFSYVAQQVSGMNTWKRDTEHVEKAFVLGGWPALSALISVAAVELGWSGVSDVFVGDPNFLDIVGCGAIADRLIDELGQRFEVERTHLKRHPVGSPAQAPIQALLAIIQREKLTESEVVAVEVAMPSLLAHTVQRSREMPDLNIHYLLSVVVADGCFSFAAAHDRTRFEKWRRAGGDSRITVVADADMEPRRQARVTVSTSDGRTLDERVDVVHGAPENPMSAAEMRDKARDLVEPVLGRGQADTICDLVLELEEVDNLSELCDVLVPRPGSSSWT